MKKNNILMIALVLTKLLQVLVIIIMTAFIAVAIHWHFNPQAYSIVDLQEGFKAGFGVKGITINASGNEPVLMSNVSKAMLYWLLLRGLIFFIVTIIIISHIQKILHSIKSIKTFYNDNIHYLKRIGYLSLLLFLFSCFNFYFDGTSPNFSLTIAFTPLLFTVGCFVLAEIFQEGKLLQEDKDQII